MVNKTHLNPLINIGAKAPNAEVNQSSNQKEVNIMQVTRDSVEQIRAEIDAALEIIRIRHGLDKLKTGNGGFDRLNGTFEFKLGGVAGGGADEFAQRYDFRQAALGLPARGSTFNNMGQAYQIFGLNKAGTKVAAARVSDGECFLFRVDHIVRIFNPQSARATAPRTAQAGSRPAGQPVPHGPDEL